MDSAARTFHAPQDNNARRCGPDQVMFISLISHGSDKDSMKELETTLENSCGLCLQSWIENFGSNARRKTRQCWTGINEDKVKGAK